MAEITSAGNTWNTNAGDKTVTATPVDNDLIVIVAACSGLAGGTTACSDNDGGTYTLVDTDRTGFSTTGVLNVFVRDALITTAGSTIFTASQSGSSGGGLVVLRVAGMTLTGASAVRSNGGQSTVASGTPAPVLSLAPHERNPIITAVASGTNGGGTTVRTGYTDVAVTGYNTPATGLDVCFFARGELSTTITWGGAAPSQFASVAIELETQERNYHGLHHAATAVMAVRDAWERKRGILVPRLWLPEGAVL
jgi:hypothetical protein